MSSTVQNGGVKLTGWAQAAAKALPKQQQPQQNARSRSTTPSNSAKNNALTTSASSVSLSSANGRGKKKQTRQPYNREQVRSHMKALFDQQVATIGNEQTFSMARGNQRKNGSLDWGAVTSSKYRNKKYGCLNEIAQVLCK